MRCTGMLSRYRTDRLDMARTKATRISLTKHLTALALAVLSAGYYALYIDAGFNFADDGNYAQTAYELFLGRPPHDLDLSYGLIWFKTGAALFHLFGVNFMLVKALFFTVITLTSVLAFYALEKISGSAVFAVLLAGVIAVAPAFPATSFYGLCVLLNAAAQMRLATRMTHGTVLDGALAGAALAFSFQIRPDFGFIFAAPLAAIVLLTFWPLNLGAGRKLLTGIVAGFAAIAVPAALLALTGGYGALVVHQYLHYPLMLVGLLLNGLRGLGQDAGAGAAITVLARPSLTDPAMATLVYVPIVVFAVFGASTLLTLKARLWRDPVTLAQAGVALVAGVAAFPHYFFFRPDLSHIANFMPGFVVMTGVFLVHLKQASWRPRIVATGGAVAVAYLVLYLAIGVPSPATGSIGMARGRTEPFRAENGVDVKVAPAELQQLTFLRDTVTANSKPGDAIVCVPYCPGVAFMTARRMLLHNFYVDDTFLVLRPQWLPSAIAETRAARPPIAIVQDWAINGTEQSRFANWAARYVDVLKDQARAQVAGPGTIIYLGGPASTPGPQ